MRLTRMLASNFARQRIRRVLVANRGEIALRIMHSARLLGIETVAVYSDADLNAQHVKFANYAVRIGEASSLSSYLNGQKIIDVAKEYDAQAIHPGYGFLSENYEFASLCESANLKFVGPSSASIKAMGQKNRAKEIMIAAGVPTLPGYNGSAQDDQTLRNEAEKIGYPVMIKPVYGGGGKGMRIARLPTDFDSALASARSESLKAFGNAEMIIEKFIDDPRHVEVQIFGDTHGNYVHLWERDCSVQRRHQKIIEEAPAPGLSTETRLELGSRAVDAAKAVAYEGAGTVEFVMDKYSGLFYFMEMNTRLQVEHPVSEAITGVDLVKWQFQIANGDRIPLKQEDIPLHGHAIEARVYAEEFDRESIKFMPTAGKLEYLRFPNSSFFSFSSSGVRVDAGVVQGDTVSVHYDPMIAKVIAWGMTRNEAIYRLNKALGTSYIGGLRSNIEFVRACLAQSEFVDGDVSTGFVEIHKSKLLNALSPSDTHETFCESAIADVLLKMLLSKRALNKSLLDSTVDFFRINHNAVHYTSIDETNKIKVEILDGTERRYRIRPSSNNKENHGDWEMDIHVDNLIILDGVIPSDVDKPLAIEFTLNLLRSDVSSKKSWKCRAIQLKDSILVWSDRETTGGILKEWPIPRPENRNTALEATIELDGDISARAPIPGIVESILVAVGDKVKKNQDLVIMNAMKMEFAIKAPCDAIVETLECQVKKTVNQQAVLIRLKTE